jgi:DNA-binding winged helix-turn-helix (wHTH) protein
LRYDAPVTGSPDAATGPIRYRFGRFVLSPARRALYADGREVRLIPRYFDLLLLLVERRHQAVHRQEIFDRVWSDVIVSDGALTQAIRTLRRTLGDDPQQPAFIRTVSRHGYQFVHPGVVREADRDGGGTAAPAASSDPNPAATGSSEGPAGGAAADPFAPLLDRLLRLGRWQGASDEERRDAAEQLHALGTSEALARLDALPGHAEARAILRDARWDVPGAGEVPLSGGPGRLAAAAAVVRLRLRRAARLAASRWAAASTGGALAGVLAGALGGLALMMVPESQANSSAIVALAAIGAAAGGLGAAGIGAGLAAAEALARSRRTLALPLCGAAGGALVGALGHLLARSVLSGLFGHDVPAVGGTVEGIVLGASAGMGYALATAGLRGGGMATPHGAGRLRAAAVTGLFCGTAGMLLAMAGRHLVAASLDVVADGFAGSSLGLAPLARLLGEQQLRPVTRASLSGFEGLLFGAGLVLGLTRRPHGN